MKLPASCTHDSRHLFLPHIFLLSLLIVQWQAVSPLLPVAAYRPNCLLYDRIAKDNI